MIDAYHELIDELSNTPEQLRDLFEGHGEPPRGTNSQWGPVETLAHLVDVERLYRERMHEVLTKKVPYLRPFDPGRAAESGDYAARAFGGLLDEFANERGETILLLVNLALKDWDRTGVHDEMGEVSIEDLAGELVDHDQEHMSEMQAALSGSG
jgi:hypothetical protein